MRTHSQIRHTNTLSPNHTHTHVDTLATFLDQCLTSAISAVPNIILSTA
uniref:Uncharacterized protein n=1 Tax=Anguilla anguilla TaxID=7936 RepID=A0A0E9VMD9_ANGAN